jgi:hypothetical protein
MEGLTMTDNDQRLERKVSIMKARKIERETGVSQYIVKRFDNTWEITDKPPLMGEWFSTDGIQHGA